MRFIEIPAALVAMYILNGNMNVDIRDRNPSFLVYTMALHLLQRLNLCAACCQLEVYNCGNTISLIFPG